MSTTGVLGFPNPVNEKAARAVAGGVALLAVVILLTGWDVLIVLMALGFLVRVLTGPRFSPLGQVATRIVAPRLGAPVWVPGPPKRFGQAIGLVLSTLASVCGLAFGAPMLAAVLVTLVLVAALMESVIGFCIGCWLFAQLMRAGVIPESTCQSCREVETRFGVEPKDIGPLIVPPPSTWSARPSTRAK